MKMKVDKRTKDRTFNKELNIYQTTYKCPHCNKEIVLDWKKYHHNCPHCNQKLEWN